MVDETAHYHFDPDEQPLPSSVVGTPDVSVNTLCPIEEIPPPKRGTIYTS
jgi:hypothetical protein